MFARASLLVGIAALSLVQAQAAAINVSPIESTSEIVNPMRGYFKWRGKWVVPQPSAPVDSYDRLYWTQLEGSTQGSYNMQPIYNGIAAAKTAGGPKAKYAFRIRAMGGPNESGTYVPLYVRNLMPNGWVNGSMYIPDWNDSDFISRYNALVARVAQEFDGSPDIAYIDIGTYGCWGEWHTGELTYPHGSATTATTATLQAYVDGYVNVFTKTRLVMMSDNETALVYAMAKVPAGTAPWIGWRRDSGGNTHFDTGMTTAKQNAVANRWQLAPVIMEAFGGDGVTPSLMPTQVTTWHVGAIGNGNLGSDTWTDFSGTDQAYFLSAGKSAGYRFVLTNVTIPQNLVQGGSFTLASQWKNTGVAPLYEPFTVRYQLRSGTTVVQEWASALDLEDWNAVGSSPTTYNDAFAVATGVAPGSYTLAVIVTSLDGSRDPLKLAITTPANADGSYSLGTVTVGSSYVAVVDDFDDGNITTPAWTMSAGTGGSVSMIAQASDAYQPASPDGSAYHSIIDFGSVATWKYAVLNRGTATFGASWSANGVNAIRFYLKGSTANGNITADSQIKVQLREGDSGDRWSYNIGNAVRDHHSDWVTVTVPFSLLYGESSNPAGATFTLSAIDQVRFFDNSAPIAAKIRVDRIEVFQQ